MRSLRSVNSNQRLRRPTVSRDDRAQASGVGVVYCGHPRMVAIEERAIRRQFRTHDLIVFINLNQLGA